MADLVEKYFQQDLTEAEQEALSGELLASDETALQFERMAGEAYARYGLPDPKPHWTDPPGGTQLPFQGFKPWLTVTVVALGTMAAVLLWHSHRTEFTALVGRVWPVGHRDESIPTSLPHKPARTHDSSGSPTAPVKAKSGQADSHPSQAEEITSSSFSARRVFPASETHSTALTSPQTQALGKPLVHSQAPPLNLDQNPSQSYSGLSVEVSLAKPAPLAVRVLDTRGGEVTALYRGNLGPGNWVFQWDGQLSDGRSAGPGYYRIEVQSGLFVQTKKIQIQ
jgi:hypothetical protein